MVKKIKVQMSTSLIPCDTNEPKIKDTYITDSVDLLLKNLGVNVTNEVLENVPENILEEGIKIFVYLSFCPELLTWSQFLTDIFENSSLKTILLQLNRIIKSPNHMTETDKQKIVLAEKIIQKLKIKFDLKFGDIGNGLSANTNDFQGKEDSVISYKRTINMGL